VDGMQLLREYDMPSPMTFKEEGGVSLSPDGSKFIAVCAFLFLCLIYFYFTFSYVCLHVTMLW